MKECIKCKQELADDAMFCHACGAKQVQEPKKCIKCGSTLAEGSNFCSVCGTKQEENPVSPNYETKQQSNDYQPVQKNFSDNPVNNGNEFNFMASSKMTFLEAVKTCFLNYANFKGRARRSEYWYFGLFNLIVAIVLMIIGGVPSKYHSNTLLTLYQLAVCCPGLAVSWRRLHDIGKSGKYILFNLIPIVGSIIFLVWTVQDSQPGTNQYGHNPKGE